MTTTTLSRPSTTQQWSEGYVVDDDIYNGVHTQMSPQNICMAMAMNQLRPPRIDEPFTYMELGCGQGLSTAVFAAANPHATFIAHDFNPAYIVKAQNLAKEAGIRNARFLERSFEEMLDEDIPPCDFIVMHGVYSWVSEAQRQHITALIRKHLKPGGAVYISYNALPGHAIFTPLRTLIKEHTDRNTGTPASRIPDAVKFAQRFATVGSNYLKAVPGLKAELEYMATKDPHYMVHEYCNESWQCFYHSEICKELSDAKLTFGGAAELINNFKRFTLSAEAHEFYREATDPIMGELIEDYVRSKTFRRDIFHRGAEKLSVRERENFFLSQHFVSQKPRQDQVLEVTVPSGRIRLEEHIYAPILDRLAKGQCSGEELHRSSDQLHQLSVNNLQQYVYALCAFDYIQPALPESRFSERRASTEQFNAAAFARNRQQNGISYLASPVTGGAAQCSPMDQLFLEAYQERTENLPRFVREAMQSAGMQLQKDGNTINDRGAAEQEIAEREDAFRSTRAALFSQLGIV